MALIAGAVIAGLIAVTFPFAGRPLPHIAAFLPMFAVFAVGADTLTAYLLMTHERVVHYPPLAVLAGAFVFSGTVAALQVLTFPGAFTERGLFDVRGQTSVWMWVFWHLGFPLLIIAYAVADARWKHADRAGRVPRSAWARAGIPIAALLALAALPSAMFAAAHLTLVDHGNFAPGFYSGVFPLVIAVNAVALTIGLVRFWKGTVIQVWVLVALFTITCDVTLNLIGAHARFTLGWYGSRICTLISTSTLLAVLIAEVHTMYASAAALAGIDGLTGIPNRRTHEDRLELTYRTALRTGRPFALIMFDVDWFKTYNDAFGHLAGDDALRAVAGAARASLGRSSDAVARYGGEEFVVVLGETNEAGARVVGERIRAAVADLKLPQAPAAGVPYLSVSVGCAAFEPQSNESPVTLRARADRALYAAKDGGRNRVEIDRIPVPVSPGGQPVSLS